MTSNQQQLAKLEQHAKELAEQIKQLQEQINHAQPTTGLLGQWAKHPNYGEVLIAEDRATDKGAIHVVYLREDMKCGARGEFVNIDDLIFPDQTTRPQDVPVGEAWLVDVDDGDDSATGAPAVKECDGVWATGENNAGGTSTWRDKEVTLITPLIPARPQDTPETVTTENEYESLPVGSVVAAWKGIPWVRRTHAWVSVGNSLTTSEMTETTRYILRRGWGE